MAQDVLLGVPTRDLHILTETYAALFTQRNHCSTSADRGTRNGNPLSPVPYLSDRQRVRKGVMNSFVLDPLEARGTAHFFKVCLES